PTRPCCPVRSGWALPRCCSRHANGRCSRSETTPAHSRFPFFTGLGITRNPRRQSPYRPRSRLTRIIAPRILLCLWVDIFGPMGKLAERLADERRSGVYRVEVTDALEEAAAIDGFPIARVRLDDVGNTPLLEACVRTLTPGVDD